MIATGIATSRATGPYCEAPLHPSSLQVSQKSTISEPNLQAI